MRYRQSKALVVSSWPILGAHPEVVVRIYRQRLCDCILDWECMLLGMDHTSPPLFQCLELDQGVTVTLRVHVLCGYLSVIVNICCHRLSHCGLNWECMLLEWIGLHSPRFVCDCDIESSRACYRSCCRGCRSCQSVHNIPKSIILSPLCFYSPS